MTCTLGMFATIRMIGLVAGVGLWATCLAAQAAPLVELTTSSEVLVGKSLAHDKQVCWLAAQDGRLSEVSLREVTSFRKVKDTFEGMSAVDLRSQLRREFGHDWEIVSTKHYLVCAPKGRAQPFAELFESVFRSLHAYVSVRGFELPEPDFPLIAVVSPNEKTFAAHCRKDNVPFIPGLRGYYHRLTNRVQVFEDDADQLSAVRPSSPVDVAASASLPSVLRIRTAWSEVGTNARQERWDANIQSNLRDTIVHESTHQAAYNLGLHTRIGENPKWVTEGLATLLEPDGMRGNRTSQTLQKRLNPDRFTWFQAFVQQRRPPHSLADFIGNDRMFQTATLDAYAQGWALSFYLAETRPSEYWRYLQSISERDPLPAYRTSARLADFQAAFGNDIDRLEVAFLRFMDDLQ